MDERAPSTPLPAGSTIGRFAIVKLIGAGGMGTVYEARDPELARSVAVKVIAAPDQRRALRFLREAQALAQLQHPNVVAVHDVGTAGDQIYLAMELVDGEVLQPGPRRWQEVLPRLIQAGRGLAAAHGKGLVHRDVKPANILVGTDGRVRIGDFGLARVVGPDDDGGPGAAPRVRSSSATTVDEGPADVATAITVDADEARSPVGAGDAITVDASPSSSAPAITADAGEATTGGRSPIAAAAATPAPLLASDLTGAGAYLGTPRYMAPEQHGRGVVTAATDQFAFCVTAWEALFGEHPFDDRGDLGAAVIAGRRRPRPAGAPAWLVRELDRGLAVDPSARHPSMKVLCDRLESIPRRRRLRFARLIGSAIGAVGLATWLLMPRRHAGGVACGRAGEAVAAVWSAPARAELAAAFARGPAFAAEVAPRLTGALDGWTSRWRDLRVDACRATHVRGQQSAAVLDRRMACLDRELATAAVVIDRLQAGGPAVAAGAFTAVDALPPPEACTAERAAAALPYPDDPRVAEVRRELDAVRVADLAGDAPAARQHADRARAAADALGHPGLRAEALLAFAGLDGQDPAAARAAREEALAQAVAAGDRDLEATVTIRLLVAAAERVEAPAITALLPVARAAATRSDAPAPIRLAFADAQATALVRLGKYDDAKGACELVAGLEAAPQPLTTRCRCFARVEAMSKDAVAPCRAALAAARAAYGEHHPMIVDRLTSLAGALARTGAPDEAITLDREALAIEEAAAGPDSLDVADVLSVSAARLIDAGRLDDARAALERALAIRRRVDGASPSRRQGHAEQKLGEVLVRMGKLAEGLTHADRGMEILEATIPADNPDLAKIYGVYGNINLAAERWPVVERAMRRCAEVAAKSLGDHHPLRAICTLGLAQVELTQGRPADAAADARTAVDLAGELHLNPINVGSAHATLGRALGETGDRKGAREHLDAAIAIFADLGPGGADNLDEARRQRRRF